MSFQVSRKISLLSLLKNFFRVCRHLPKIYLANYIFEQFTFSSCALWSPSNWHYQKRKNLNIFRPKEKSFSDAVKDVFDSRLVANCAFFFMAFLDSFFPEYWQRYGWCILFVYQLYHCSGCVQIFFYVLIQKDGPIQTA